MPGNLGTRFDRSTVGNRRLGSGHQRLVDRLRTVRWPQPVGPGLSVGPGSAVLGPRASRPAGSSSDRRPGGPVDGHPCTGGDVADRNPPPHHGRRPSPPGRSHDGPPFPYGPGGHSGGGLQRPDRPPPDVWSAPPLPRRRGRGGCRGGPPQQCIGGFRRHGKPGSLQPGGPGRGFQRVGHGSGREPCRAGRPAGLSSRSVSGCLPSGRLALPAGWGTGLCLLLARPAAGSRPGSGQHAFAS